MVYAGYLYPEEIFGGKLQPHVRFQSFDADGSFTGLIPNPAVVTSNTDTEQTDIGVNFLLNGHSARISAVYSSIANTTEFPTPAVDTHNTVHQFVIGTQVMF